MDSGGPEPDGGAEPESFAGQNGSPDNPGRLARAYLRSIGDCDGRLLRFYRGEFMWWEGGRFREVPRADFRARLTRFLEGEMERVHQMENRGGDDEDEEEGNDERGGKGAIPVTRSMVDNVIQSLAGHCLLDADTEAPAWINGAVGPDPAGPLAMPNGVLDLEAAADGKPDCLLPPTPDFFVTNATAFDYDPCALEPRQCRRG